MTKCEKCGTHNLDGSQYCDECGAELPGISELSGINNIEGPQAFQMASVTSIGIPYAPDDNGGIDQPKLIIEDDTAEKHVGVHSKLIIERGISVGKEFPLAADESSIGRWDADNGIFPDVDLDAHDPEAKVSRRHARIILEDGKYFLEDLGSTNGTFVNRGRRLLPGNRHILNNGDEIIVGKTFLRFSILG